MGTRATTLTSGLLLSNSSTSCTVTMAHHDHDHDHHDDYRDPARPPAAGRSVLIKCHRRRLGLGSEPDSNFET
eukprot:3934632-Rhodomonas_salina.1